MMESEIMKEKYFFLYEISKKFSWKGKELLGIT